MPNKCNVLKHISISNFLGTSSVNPSEECYISGRRIASVFICPGGKPVNSLWATEENRLGIAILRAGQRELCEKSQV